MAQQLSAYNGLSDLAPHIRLCVEFEPGQEIRELRWVLDRAMNCMDPKDMPPWLRTLSTTVDKSHGASCVKKF